LSLESENISSSACGGEVLQFSVNVMYFGGGESLHRKPTFLQKRINHGARLLACKVKQIGLRIPRSFWN